MTLTKAYDVAALVAALKAKGIDQAEVLVTTGVSTLCDWLKSSMALSSNGLVGHLDDLAVPVVDIFEKFVNSKLAELAATVSAAEAAPTPAAPGAVPAPAASAGAVPAPAASAGAAGVAGVPST